MHQCRHHALGVQLQVFRVVLLGREQVDQVLVVRQVLFGQRHEDFLRADRIVEGVEGEHFDIPPDNIAVRTNIQQSDSE